MKIAIVGGGIAGLSTANALKLAGFQIHVYEQAPAFTEVGAGILIGTGAMQILEQWNLKNIFLARSIPIKQTVITNTSLQKIVTTPTSLVGYSIHRAELINVLKSTLASDEYTLNARIEDIEVTEDKVCISLNNEKCYYDFLVAANGINSNIRNQFLQQVKPRQVQQVWWRGITKTKLPEALESKMFEMWGMNKRFGFMQKPDGEYFWWAILWEKEVADNQFDRTGLAEKFKQFHPVTQQLISSSTTFFDTTIRDVKTHNFAWHTKRIVFVGDAIHACTPDIAQGGSQAIESAYQLAKSLQQYKTDLNKAFEDYVIKRKKKAAFINDTSYRFGRMGHYKEQWKYNLLFTTLRLLPGSFLRNKIKKINAVDL